MDALLRVVAVGHLALGSVLVAALTLEATPIGGAHPAAKPAKFALSIGVFLLAMAYVVPRLEVADGVRRAIAWTLAVTMAVEMAAIVLQAARGTSSHFNLATPLDAAIWRIMAGAILVAMLAIVASALLATVRPLGALAPADALAWRAGLWLLVLAAISGVAMAGASQHSVGGADGGAGLAVTGWSTTHGDLRVSHFFALHALQALPLLAFALGRLGVVERVRVGVVAVAAGVALVLALATLLQAQRGVPLTGG